MILQTFCLLLGLNDRLLFLPLPLQVLSRVHMGGVPMVFIISVGVDVVVVCEGGEVLRIEYSISVPVLFPHDLATSETSPLVESVSLVDYQFAPEVSVSQFDIFHILDKSIRQVCLGSFDVLQEFLLFVLPCSLIGKVIVMDSVL